MLVRSWLKERGHRHAFLHLHGLTPGQHDGLMTLKMERLPLGGIAMMTYLSNLKNLT